jgi:hypothetical protein
MSKNVALAKQVRALTREHAEWLDMDNWIETASPTAVSLHDIESGEAPYGTTACFAGWVCLVSGYQLDWLGSVFRDGRRILADVDSISRVYAHASGKAAELLGIDEHEACRIFMADNDQLDERLAEVFGEPI